MRKMNFFLISKLLFFPTATVVVAHSPTPSAVNITASSKGDGKKGKACPRKNKSKPFKVRSPRGHSWSYTSVRRMSHIACGENDGFKFFPLTLACIPGHHQGRVLLQEP